MISVVMVVSVVAFIWIIVLSLLILEHVGPVQKDSKRCKKSSDQKVNKGSGRLKGIRECRKCMLVILIMSTISTGFVWGKDKMERSVTSSKRKVNYCYSQNNMRKTLDEAFFYDDTPTVNDVETEYWKMLDWELYSGTEITSEILQRYCRKCGSEYYIAPEKRDVKMSDLTSSDQAKVRGLAGDILEYEGMATKKTTAQLEAEQEACLESLKIRPTAQMSFLTARVTEDIFWAYVSKYPVDKKKLLKNAAITIDNFKEFLKYENRELQVDDETQKGYIEDVCFRNGKLLYQMALQWDESDKRVHFLCMSYARMNEVYSQEVCFGTKDERNLNQALGCYYKAMICEEMLNYINNQVFYKQICESGIEACKSAKKLWKFEYRRELDSEKRVESLEEILKVRLKSAA